MSSGAPNTRASLAQVAAAAAESPQAALHALLEVWRERPLVEVAELVDLVLRRIPPAASPAMRSLTEEHEGWMAMEERRDPADLDALLMRLVCARSSLSKERLERIVTWPDDPRLRSGLARLTLERPFTSLPNRPFWTTLFRALKSMAHPMMLPILRKAQPAGTLTQFDDYLRVKLSALIEGIERRPLLVPTVEEKGLLLALSKQLGSEHEKSGQKVAEDFLREIWARPDDDGARLVFADWLQERADPRGEFIVLQFTRAAGKGTPEALKRERALLAEHGGAWMGPLEPAAKHPRFERGFLHSCRIMWRRLLSTPGLLQHPAWATVREYELEPAGERACDAWLDHMIALGAKRV